MIKRYSNYINEADDQRVYLNDNQNGTGFYTNKYGPNSIANLNQKIYNYIDKVYGPFGFSYPRSGSKANYDVTINGEFISGEYLSKMVNNYTIFKTFIRENKIKDENTFYSLLESKFNDVYHYNGDFFKRQTLPILINTTRKGNVNEIKCKQKFIDYAKSKNLNIVITDPSVAEDVDGIDAKFTHNGRTFTIQIKPFSEYKTIGDKLYAKSAGSLSVGSVNYLMLYSDTEYLIIKNASNSPITIKGDVFIAPLSNVIYRD
jgi:hypothetical protein